MEGFVGSSKKAARVKVRNLEHGEAKIAIRCFDIWSSGDSILCHRKHSDTTQNSVLIISSISGSSGLGLSWSGNLLELVLVLVISAGYAYIHVLFLNLVSPSQQPASGRKRWCPYS